MNRPHSRSVVRARSLAGEDLVEGTGKVEAAVQIWLRRERLRRGLRMIFLSSFIVCLFSLTARSIGKGMECLCAPSIGVVASIKSALDVKSTSVSWGNGKATIRV